MFNCANCGSAFQPVARNVKRQRFCSAPCRMASQAANQRGIQPRGMKKGEFNKLNPDHVDFGAPFRKAFGESSFNRLVRQYRANATRRGLSFDLSPEQVRILTSSDCTYCGREPRQIMTSSDAHGHYIYNGIDRMNPALDYILSNCRPACKRCNFAKSSMSHEEWMEFIDDLTSHRIRCEAA